MKKTKFVTTIALITAGVTCFLPSANAETTPDREVAPIVSEESSDNDKQSESKVEKVVDETIIKSEEKVEKTMVKDAKLIIITSEKTTTIDLNGANKLSEIAKEYKINLSEYRNTKGEPLNESYVVSDKEELLLFKSEMSAKSEVIELQIPTIEEKSDELYIGEKKVESEGKTGKALKTFVHTNDLSADKKVNAEATDSTAPTAEVSSLTVLIKPEAKKILIGTKPKPAPVVEEPEVEEDATTDTTDEVTQETDGTENNPSTIDRDPISGEPLNTDAVTSSRSSSRTDGVSGSSTANGIKTEASSTAPSSIVASNKARGDKAVELAYTRLGSDYNWASSGERAFDCSGLIYWIYKQNLGLDIPRVASQQGSSAQQIPLNQLQPGDLLYTSSHIGLYIGDGKMIHASRSNDEVVVSGIGWFIDDGAKGARFA